LAHCKSGRDICVCLSYGKSVVYGISAQRENNMARERMKGGRKRDSKAQTENWIKAIGIIRKIFLNFKRICIKVNGLLFHGACCGGVG
jgi:hypothetical protein